MIRTENTRPDFDPDGDVPAGKTVSPAATPEQAAALYDEQARQAAALEAAIGGLNGVGIIAALPIMSVQSLDHMTRGYDWKLARARMKLAEPLDD